MAWCQGGLLRLETVFIVYPEAPRPVLRVHCRLMGRMNPYDVVLAAMPVFPAAAAWPEGTPGGRGGEERGGGTCASVVTSPPPCLKSNLAAIDGSGCSLQQIKITSLRYSILATRQLELTT